jgi:NADH-quinone oxidoreductase subunit M
MLPSVLLGILLALPFVAAALVALLGSRHGMLGLFGAHHELAEVVGSHEVADALVARAQLRQGHAVRWVSLVTTLIALALSIVLAVGVARPRIESGGAVSGALPELRTNLITLDDGSAIQFFLRMDGMNIWLIVLTTVLMVSSVLVSWTAITERINEYFAWMLFLEGAMLGVFMAFDIVLFYVFFELTLVPLFFLIGIWGGEERQYAARKFFIYTFGGSLITLVGLIGVILVLSRPPTLPHSTDEKVIPAPPAARVTFSIPDLVQASEERSRYLPKRLEAAREEEDRAKKANNLESPLVTRAIQNRQAAEDQAGNWRTLQYFLFAAMMVGFAIKVPMFPVHTWLPLAHVQAPTAGSVLLAGVLLKLGTYGFLRLCLPLAPDAALTFGAPFLGTLAVIGILYGSFCALAQDDMKKLVAYSSVSHLGYCMLGLFALNHLGLQGALLQMINHGLSTGALFLLVGMIYERYHTRKIADYGGMAAKLKVMGTFMVIITMSSVGLPGLNGFVGEFFVLAGMFGSQNHWINGQLFAVLSSFGVVLGAWYMLTLLRGVYFGEIKEPHHGQGSGHGHDAPTKDLNIREWGALAPIAALCLVLGVYPQPFLDTANLEIREVSRTLDQARERRAPEEARAQGTSNAPAVAVQTLANPAIGE